jgi:hypothetical protein
MSAQATAQATTSFVLRKKGMQLRFNLIQEKDLARLRWTVSDFAQTTAFKSQSS